MGLESGPSNHCSRSLAMALAGERACLGWLTEGPGVAVGVNAYWLLVNRCEVEEHVLESVARAHQTCC
jgi:hypothetical protein